jgi:hypothetical protein
MVRKFQPRRDSLSESRKQLLLQEEGRTETLESDIQHTAEAAWISGTLYFRGKSYNGTRHTMVLAVATVARRWTPEKQAKLELVHALASVATI